jgi:hypothetical protein
VYIYIFFFSVLLSFVRFTGIFFFEKQTKLHYVTHALGFMLDRNVRN